MREFCAVVLSFALCMLTFNPLVISFPAENEIRDTAPLVEMVTKEIPKSVSSFSLYLLKKLVREKPEENLLFSPLSAYGAIMMLHLGASDKTRGELSDVLNLSGVEKNHDKLHEAFSEVLRKVEQKASNTEDRKPETIIANGFFVQKDYPIHESYLQSLHKYYNSFNATNVDFLEHAGEATETINSFIADKTRQRIQKVYDVPLPSTTVSVLSSALYFHGIWEHTFNKDYTKMGKFHTGNSEIEVPMMQDQQVIAHSHSDVLQMDTIELPYKGGEYSMSLLLPRPTQTIKNMTEHIQLYDVREIVQNTKVEGVDFKIPKMKFSWKHSVKSEGLESIFRSVDLSRLTEKKVSISEMLHATEIEVDEQGTVASAATATNVVKSVPPTVNAVYKFYVDRPFVMVVIHKPTQMVIFDGVVYRPQW